MSEMIEKFSSYLPRPYLDSKYFQYRMRNEGDYTVTVETTSGELNTYWSASISKKQVI
ncbi:hypothetical protein Q0590_35605 [Rhodocytophaga aerolata]|uniref:Uncharacterized protein n=1 Tax=Rhodocytophaga aerolata TaxID=455078 RepID=A0ABT8RI57_9BACT|nr:hypothetical protein [Rhodocytophaga aerolata]MDO1451654.1 hypothetical protein [Rhodocytophaga aerolata]